MRTLSGMAALSVTTDVSSLGQNAMAANGRGYAGYGRARPPATGLVPPQDSQVQAKMKERKLNAMLLLDATNIIYTTGYFHLSTERPIAALIPESGDPVLFVPSLEIDQVQLWWVKDYESYFDFPGPVNRVRWIFERVAKRGLASGRIGVEEPRPGRLHQMKLGAPKAEIVDAGDLVEELRWVKDDDEDADHAAGHVFRRFQRAGRARFRAAQWQRH